MPLPVTSKFRATAGVYSKNIINSKQKMAQALKCYSQV